MPMMGPSISGMTDREIVACVSVGLVLAVIIGLVLGALL